MKKCLDKGVHYTGPLKKEYPGPEKPVVELVEKLLNRRNAAYIRVQKGGFSLALRKQS